MSWMALLVGLSLHEWVALPAAVKSSGPDPCAAWWSDVAAGKLGGMGRRPRACAEREGRTFPKRALAFAAMPGCKGPLAKQSDECRMGALLYRAVVIDELSSRQPKPVEQWDTPTLVNKLVARTLEEHDYLPVADVLIARVPALYAPKKARLVGRFLAYARQRDQKNLSALGAALEDCAAANPEDEQLLGAMLFIQREKLGDAAYGPFLEKLEKSAGELRPLPLFQYILAEHAWQDARDRNAALDHLAQALNKAPDEPRYLRARDALRQPVPPASGIFEFSLDFWYD